MRSLATRLSIALAPVAAATPLPALAQAYQCRVPQSVAVPQVRPDGPVRRVPVTGYTLALSWAPEFCKGRETRAADRAQCSGRGGRFGLVVHGLWPDGRGTWPQWCPTPYRVTPREAARNMCMMPSARLQASEWAKHGACMVRAPGNYFEVTRILWNSLRLPDLDRLSKEPGLTAGMLRDSWVLANPAWPRSAVGVKANERGWLQELRLCYGRDFMPAPCDRRRLGTPDSAPLRIWRGF
ncbi:ribonuclease T2 family protein [Tsuneonella amylolytica]|uniref:ribonuclease T2 family protein n=1 Tax=Tsuneonella amylolytica TaxID=2338327 RepID=UPI000EAA8EE0|nr:ribonuclease T [Tsuneonella amylolytica]